MRMLPIGHWSLVIGHSFHTPSSMSNLYITRRVLPLPQFFLERAALVDFELAVVGAADRVTLQRTRGGAFEVDAVFIKTAAVAGTLEFLFAFEPVGSAAEV